MLRRRSKSRLSKKVEMREYNKKRKKWMKMTCLLVVKMTLMVVNKMDLTLIWMSMVMKTVRILMRLLSCQVRMK